MLVVGIEDVAKVIDVASAVIQKLVKRANYYPADMLVSQLSVSGSDRTPLYTVAAMLDVVLRGVGTGDVSLRQYEELKRAIGPLIV